MTVDLDEAAVRFLLREHFGLEVLAQRALGGEAATVCRVRTREGVFVLKAMAATDPGASGIVWQGEVQTLVREQGLPAARLVPGLDGERTVVVVERGGGDRVLALQLAEWLGGTPLAELDPDEAVLREVGLTAARVSSALAAAPPPPTEVEHAWELRRTRESILTALPAIADARTRALCAAAAERFAVEVEPVLPLLPQTVLHHDLHDANLLFEVTASGDPRMSGILDFGDLTSGARVAELVVAAAYAARPHPDPGWAVAVTAAGWSEVRVLDERELAMLHPGVIARLGVNAAVWASRLGGPRDDYARARAAGSLQPLERLLARPSAEAAERTAAVLRSRARAAGRAPR